MFHELRKNAVFCTHDMSTHARLRRIVSLGSLTTPPLFAIREAKPRTFDFSAIFNMRPGNLNTMICTTRSDCASKPGFALSYCYNLIYETELKSWMVRRRALYRRIKELNLLL